MNMLANVTGIAVGGRGLLFAGPPGSGKSALALALIDRGAVLIGDDAVEAVLEEGHPWLAPPANTQGMIEVRNVGIVEVPTARAPLALVLALDPEAPRFPLEVLWREIVGIKVPLLFFAPGDTAQALRAEYALAAHGLVFPGTGNPAHKGVP